MGEILDYTDYMSAGDILDHGWGGEEQLGQRVGCRYCLVRGVQRHYPALLAEVFNVGSFPDSKYIHEGEATDIKYIKASACIHCGWWQYEKAYYHNDSTYTVQYHLSQAKLKSFPANSPSVPVTSALSNIRRWPELIHDLDPTKMELIVQAVLSDHFDCEVRHVGRTADGGIDLLVVLADEIIPVQVKRRANPDAVEPVQTVREMFGVMFRDGFSRASVVTSAKAFSRQALTEVAKAMDRNSLNAFDLIDRPSFLAMIGADSRLLMPTWRNFLPAGEDVTTEILGSTQFRAYLDKVRSREENARSAAALYDGLRLGQVERWDG